MTPIKYLLFVALLSVPVPLWAQAQTTLRPVAVVNDDIISLVDVIQRSRLSIIGSQQQLSPQQEQQLLNRTLKNMIDDQIKIQEAERLGIVIAQDELDQTLNNVASRNNQSADQVLATLKAAGIHKTTLFNQFRAELAWIKVVRREIDREVVISAAEIDAVMTEIEKTGSGVEKRVFEIFLPLGRDARESDIRSQARALMSELENGANFGAVARSTSRAASANFGGDLGWIQVGQLPGELRQAVRDARPDTLIGPLQTGAGFYILTVRGERTTSHDTKFDLVRLSVARDPAADFTTQQAAEARIAALERATNSCTEARDYAQNPENKGSKNLGIIALNDIDSSAQEAIKDLQAGQKTAVITTENSLDLYYVCGRQDNGINRLDIEQKLRNDRLNILAEKYLQDLRKNANIDLRL